MPSLLDNFNGTAGTDLTAHTSDSGHSWTLATDGFHNGHSELDGSGALVGDGSDTVSSGIPVVSLHRSSDAPETADYAAAIRIRTETADYSGFASDRIIASIYVRATASDAPWNWYGCGFRTNGAGALINGLGAGASGSIAYAVDSGAEAELAVSVVGTRVRALINGVQLSTWTDATTSAAGKVAIIRRDDGTDPISIMSVVRRTPPTRRIILEGDSHLSGGTALNGLASAMTIEAGTESYYSVNGFATSGHTSAQVLSGFAAQIAPEVDETAEENIFVCFVGTNDTGTAQQTYDNLVAIGEAAKAAGYDRVVIATPAARGSGGLDDAERLALIALLEADFPTATADDYVLLRSAAGNGYADALVRVGSMPEFDAVADTADTDYYTDGVHFTAAAQAILGASFGNAIGAELPSAARPVAPLLSAFGFGFGF